MDAYQGCARWQLDMVREQDGHQPKFSECHEIEKRAWDDIAGTDLAPEEVKIARMIQIHSAKKNVWTRISRSAALRNGREILKTRWIDINKGHHEN